MFLLAAGSVCISCASAPGGRVAEHEVSINTGKAADGKLYTSTVFTEIRSVLVTDSHDRSKKNELREGDWEYNPETTELIIKTRILFDDYIAGVTGTARFPDTFVLAGISDPNSLMVILGGRLAIDGYDYTYNPDTGRLVFRSDIDINKQEWYIQYDSGEGSASMGEWKPENGDRISYIEAEHRRQYLNKWYDGQDAFWFWGTPKEPGQKPELVRRKATPAELAEMKNLPVTVLKFRRNASARSLSHELGYKISFPEKITLPQYAAGYQVKQKIIEECAENGALTRKLSLLYEPEKSSPKADMPAILTLYILPPGMQPETEAQKNDYTISTQMVDLGLQVRQERYWVMLTSSLEGKPDVRSWTEWIWHTAAAGYSISADSSEESVYEPIIRQLIQSTK